MWPVGRPARFGGPAPARPYSSSRLIPHSDLRHLHLCSAPLPLRGGNPALRGVARADQTLLPSTDPLNTLEVELRALYASRPDKGMLEDLVEHISHPHDPSVPPDNADCTPASLRGRSAEPVSREMEESDEECAWAPGSPSGRQGSDLVAAKSAQQSTLKCSRNLEVVERCAIPELSGHDLIAVCSSCSHPALREQPLRAACGVFAQCAEQLDADDSSIVPGTAQLLEQREGDQQRVAILYTTYSPGLTEVGMSPAVSAAVRKGWLESALADLARCMQGAEGVQNVGLLVSVADIDVFKAGLKQFSVGSVGLQFRLLVVDGQGFIVRVVPSSECTGAVHDAYVDAATNRTQDELKRSEAERLNAEDERRKAEQALWAEKEQRSKEVKRSQEERRKAEHALEEEKQDRQREEQIVADELAQLEAHQLKLRQAAQEADHKRIKAEEALIQLQAECLREEELVVHEMEQISQKTKLELQRQKEEHDLEVARIQRCSICSPPSLVQYKAPSEETLEPADTTPATYGAELYRQYVTGAAATGRSIGQFEEDLLMETPRKAHMRAELKRSEAERLNAEDERRKAEQALWAEKEQRSKEVKRSQEERRKAEHALEEEKQDRQREEQIVADELAQLEAHQLKLRQAAQEADHKRIKAEEALIQLQAEHARHQELTDETSKLESTPKPPGDSLPSIPQFSTPQMHRQSAQASPPEAVVDASPTEAFPLAATVTVEKAGFAVSELASSAVNWWQGTPESPESEVVQPVESRDQRLRAENALHALGKGDASLGVKVGGWFF